MTLEEAADQLNKEIEAAELEISKMGLRIPGGIPMGVGDLQLAWRKQSSVYRLCTIEPGDPPEVMPLTSASLTVRIAAVKQLPVLMPALRMLQDEAIVWIAEAIQLLKEKAWLR